MVLNSSQLFSGRRILPFGTPTAVPRLSNGQPPSKEALEIFEVVVFSFGFQGGINIDFNFGRPVASLAMAQKGIGIRSHLNYAQAMLSASKLKVLADALDLQEEPKWIDVPPPV